MSSFRIYMNFGNDQQTSQQTNQQTSQQTSQPQTIRLGSTTKRVCAALYVQGNKTCNTCGSKRK